MQVLKRVASGILNVLILVTLGYVMLRDGGPIRVWWEARVEARLAELTLTHAWSSLAQGGAIVTGDGAADLIV